MAGSAFADATARKRANVIEMLFLLMLLVVLMILR
jgi:hypothetical protein